tara:strand:+ start:3016 stop:3399 length:384 start_codon:yes stop_codon:yes gene_type:complete
MSRILVVENEAGVRALVAEVLRDDGFDVVEAASGDEALNSLLLGESVDLVLTDIDMPGTLDGLALAECVRTRFPHIPIILNSGGPRRAQARLVENFIPKPFRIDELLLLVRTTIVRQRDSGQADAGP